MLSMVIEALSVYLPDNLNRALLRVVPFSRVQKLMRLSDTVERRSREIVEEKRVLLEKGDSAMGLALGEGKDIMSILSAYLLPWPSVQYDSVLTLFSESEHGGLCRRQTARGRAHRSDVVRFVRRQIICLFTDVRSQYLHICGHGHYFECSRYHPPATGRASRVARQSAERDLDCAQRTRHHVRPAARAATTRCDLQGNASPLSSDAHRTTDVSECSDPLAWSLNEYHSAFQDSTLTLAEPMRSAD